MKGRSFFNFSLQPKSLFPTSSTGTYEISDVCNTESPFLRVPSEKLSVRCDMDTDDGGWIVIQRRVNGGTVNFTKNWDTCEQGFGDLEGEFWFGLRNIHCLTTREEVELRIDMKRTNGAHINWTYQEFRVDGPEDNYRLHISQGEGTTGTPDGLAYHNNSPFSTYDRDNDAHNTNCAVTHKAGWWYKGCRHTVLTAPHGSSYGFRWYSNSLALSDVEMKVRPKTCTLAASRQCD